MIAIVPARGGSKTVRRKNVQVVDGKPLLCHVADTLASVGHAVYVSTEDPEIRSIALVHGYKVVDRPADLSEDRVTVDEVARHAIDQLGPGPFIVAQPTVPRLTKGTLHRMEHALQDHTAVTLVTPNTHLLRKKDTMLTERWNRQQLDTVTQEVGVRMFRHADYLGTTPLGTVVVEEWEALDIDTVSDLEEARRTRKQVTIYTMQNHMVGTGHHHRARLLGDTLQHHDITISEDRSDPGRSDLSIIDRLDTTIETVAGLKAAGEKVVTFEDVGYGSQLADLTVNALYPRLTGLYGTSSRNERTGPDWADLRPEFVGLPPYETTDEGRILLMFGGTDPADLGEQVAKWFPHATWVRPGDNVSVAYEMMNHDLLITSAGRTVYEAAAVGIPTVTVAQNHRETTHAHLDNTVYLGLGRLLDMHRLGHTVDKLLSDPVLREELSRTRSVDGKGMDRIRLEVDRLLL